MIPSNSSPSESVISDAPIDSRISAADSQAARSESENDRDIASLRHLFRRYRGPILLTYGLIVLENLIRLVQPLVMGLAISDLIQSSPRGMLLFMLQCGVQMLVTCGRHLYDTRTFGTISADLAGDMVLQQRADDVETSRVAARSSLSRQLVSFFEMGVPVMATTLFALLGALAVLVWYDAVLGFLCGVSLCCYAAFSRLLARKSAELNQRRHDLQELEVDVVERHNTGEVRDHFSTLRNLQVKLSDWHAASFGLMNFCLVLFLGVIVLRWETMAAMSAGDLVSLIRYAVMFVSGLTNVPMVVQQLVRLADICRRLRRRPAVQVGWQQS